MEDVIPQASISTLKNLFCPCEIVATSSDCFCPARNEACKEISLALFEKERVTETSPCRNHGFFLPKAYYSLPLIIASVALATVQDRPTASRRDFAMPFPVPVLTYMTHNYKDTERVSTYQAFPKSY